MFLKTFRKVFFIDYERYLVSLVELYVVLIQRMARKSWYPQTSLIFFLQNVYDNI